MTPLFIYIITGTRPIIAYYGSVQKKSALTWRPDGRCHGVLMDVVSSITVINTPSVEFNLSGDSYDTF